MTHPPIGSQITFVYTDDLDKSIQFYEGIMNLRLWLDQGSCRIYAVTNQSYLGVCQSNPASKGKFHPGEQTNVILTLVTDAVDEWYTYLQDKGIVFEKAPEENPTYKIYHCFLRDPNGYLIEIQRFLSENANL